MMLKLIQGDCLKKMQEIPVNSVDSIVTDPPYGIGFLGAKWDSLPPGKEVFEECLRVLKPGGYLLSFGGTKTYHRMASAVEDAGFEIRDMLEWIYGSGFPKSYNISKGIAKISKKASEWEGWGTALKPAHEPICMARKPLSEKTIARNVLTYETGGINIDECRIGDTSGRFPANLIHDNSEELRKCFPETKSGTISKNYKQKKRFDVGEKGKGSNLDESNCYGDSGNALRFFKSINYCAKASRKERGEYNKHLTVKPIALMEYLVKMTTKEGGTVLDPFMGSGTTGIACVNLDRYFIGIEIDPVYFKLAERRIGESLGG